MGACAAGGPRSSWVFPLIILHALVDLLIITKLGSHWSRSTWIHVGQLASKCKGSAHFHLFSAGITHHCTQSFKNMDAGI